MIHHNKEWVKKTEPLNYEEGKSLRVHQERKNNWSGEVEYYKNFNYNVTKIILAPVKIILAPICNTQE